jgi:hypothetical protein
MAKLVEEDLSIGHLVNHRERQPELVDRKHYTPSRVSGHAKSADQGVTARVAGGARTGGAVTGAERGGGIDSQRLRAAGGHAVSRAGERNEGRDQFSEKAGSATSSPGGARPIRARWRRIRST